MKKMITAALAAFGMALGAVTLDPQECSSCGGTPIDMGGCDVVAFKLTASGKATADNGKYKEVKSLKVTKGMLVLTAQSSTNGEETCCYSTADIYAVVKVGKKSCNVVIRDVDVAKWSMFGKYAEDVANYLTTMKKGSSRKLDSDLAVHCQDAEVDGDCYSTTITLCASAFGTVKATNCKGSKKKESLCSAAPAPGECVLDFKPGTYSGTFSGLVDLLPYGQLCFTCECGEDEVVNGTWKAKYDEKIKTREAAQKHVFGKTVDE